jgi:hypothetical protein
VICSGIASRRPPFVDSTLTVFVLSGRMLVPFSTKSQAPATSTGTVPRTGPARVGPMWIVMVLPGPGILAVPVILQSPRVRNCARTMLSVSAAGTVTVTVAALLEAP